MLKIISIYFNKLTKAVKNSHKRFYQYIPINAFFRIMFAPVGGLLLKKGFFCRENQSLNKARLR